MRFDPSAAARRRGAMPKRHAKAGFIQKDVMTVFAA
ncbi:MAG: hypothetical protein JWQ69_3498, partial [Pseudomonas sp.]|nr:hypothetical protein [Pseudomonas sp.]